MPLLLLLCWDVRKGVLHWELDADNHESDPALDKIRADRGYSYQVRCTVQV